MCEKCEKALAEYKARRKSFWNECNAKLKPFWDEYWAKVKANHPGK